MLEFVLDASFAISWCFPDDPSENTEYSRRVLDELCVRRAVVPEIWPYEIANILSVAHTRRNRISESQIPDYLGLLRTLRIRREGTRGIWDGLGLEVQARNWGIAVYDASYLSLAIREGIPLATSDERLRRVAANIGIEILGFTTQ